MYVHIIIINVFESQKVSQLPGSNFQFTTMTGGEEETRFKEKRLMLIFGHFIFIHHTFSTLIKTLDSEIYKKNVLVSVIFFL